MARYALLTCGVALAFACTNEMRFLPLGLEPEVDAGAGFGAGAQGGAGAAPSASGGAGTGSEPADTGGSAGSSGAPSGSSGAGGSAGAPPDAPVGPPGEWLLTFREECGSALNPLWITHWDTFEGERTTEHTGEYMADDRVALSGGACVITADDTPNADRQFTSGTLNTAGKFAQEYGYFEARLQAPRGVGLWTDWRLRDRAKWPPAVDVTNVFGRDVGAAQLSHYWGEAFPNHSSWVQSYAGGDLSADFHVYGVDWSASELVWYVDGVERARTQEGVAAQTGARYLSLAILIGTGEAPAEPPDTTTTWPVQLSIDWVRAWRRP